MIGGVFLLARAIHARWRSGTTAISVGSLGYLADEGAYYVELYYSELDRPEQHQHVVFAIMPGDPGEPGQGHVINYRVDDVDTIVARLHRGWRGDVGRQRRSRCRGPRQVRSSPRP